MICCLRQLQEKCTEQDRPLYMVFVNFSKVSNTVGRTGLWQLLRKYGCPEKFTTMIEALHTEMMANVNVGGEVCLRIVQCYKQARLCTSPHALLHLPVSNARRGFLRHDYIQSRQSTDLFNIAHFRVKTKITQILMTELLFAYDNVLVARSAEEMQKIVDAFFNASKKFSLKT